MAATVAGLLSAILTRLCVRVEMMAVKRKEGVRETKTRFVAQIIPTPCTQLGRVAVT